MSSRRASDGGSSVLSFTFLDVLMCTMGSLLLLLVVFGVIAQKATRKRREGEVASISLAALSAPTAPPAATGPDAESGERAAEDPDDLLKQLEALQVEQDRLEKLRSQAAEARERERARISHLEDHERRLEHELAKLNLALQALEDAEKKQHVDQAQADAEAERLKKLIAETEERLAKMREDVGEKSYAIVPYKGANGTFRRPVFIECTVDAVTIQPEGIRLTVEDFDGPLRSGNPLAAAVRAAHEELNKRALAAGAELPDAYPLLIVRPDGAAAYSVALDAIRSWDTDFGYEFVESDWNLTYAEPDPRLGQVMAHAVDEARQRQALLAQVAPGQYGPRLGGGGSGDGTGGVGGNGHGSGGNGFVSLSTSGDGRIGSRAADGSLGSGAGGGPGGANKLRGSAGGADGNFSDEFAASSGGGSGAAAAAGESTPGLLAGRASGDGTAGEGYLGPRYGSPNGGAGNAARGAAADSQFASQSGGGGSDPANGGTAAQASGGATGQVAASVASSGVGGSTGSSDFASGAASSAGGSGGGSSSSMAGGAGRGASGNIGSSDEPSSPLTTARGSIADSRGVNWANVEASRRASAITRPIRVQVSAEHIEVLRDADAPSGDAQSVSFHQPVDRMMDQLAGAVQSCIEEWGLAGDGMYWRPTLVVSVAPGADKQARRLAELLENSGIDVKLPQSVAAAAEGDGRATR